MKKTTLWALLLSVLAAGAAFTTGKSEESNCSTSKTNIMESNVKATVQQFYTALSTQPNDQTAAQTASWMAADWKSLPTPPGGAGLEGFVKTLFMFHGMIPDLKWEVQEMLVSGNRVTVRSKATGTPNSPEGYFFGVPTDGSKSFEIQTIDIHTVEKGKLVSAFHCEDWATAIQQVSGH